MRRKFHDTFEATHRFLGWSATALVWGQVVLLTNDYRGTVPLGMALVRSPPLWLAAIMTSNDTSLDSITIYSQLPS